MKHNLLYALILLILFFSGTVAAEENQPPWLQPHVLQAYVNIGLTDEQKPAFNAAMAEYVQLSGRAINKVISTNKGNLKREIKRVTKKHLKRWSKNVAGIVTPEQYPKFEIYRDTLVATIASTN